MHGAQAAARRIDRIDGQPARQLAGGDQPASGRVDSHAARLRFGRGVVDQRQPAARRIDRESGDRARRAVGGVEEAAVGRRAQFGGPGLVDETGRQHVDRLLARQRSGERVEVENVDAAVELVEAMDVPVVGRKNQMARAAAGANRGAGAGRQVAVVAEPEGTDRVAAERRHQQPAVGRVDQRRVRARQFALDLAGGQRRALRVERKDGEQIGAVRRAENDPPLAVARNVGRPARRRRAAERRQLAVGRVDGECGERVVGARSGVDDAPPRADAQRTGRSGGRDALAQAHLAAVAGERENVDFAALRAGYIDERLGHGHSPGKGKERRRSRC